MINRRELFTKAIVRFVSGVVLLGVLLFVPAGTFAWPGAWRLMGALFIPMLAAGLIMFTKDPSLLEKRLRMREQGEQRQVIALSGIMFVLAFVLAGLSLRFGWIMFPEWVSRAGVILLLAGYLLFAEVLRENRYLSRTVEVQEGQQVVDTGLYGIVRHPMYFATVILFLSMPLVLGSVVSFPVMLLYLPIIAKRIRGEEEMLERELTGYLDYEKKVRCRMIPFVW